MCFIYCEYIMTKLLFHRIGLTGTSPFDEAIVSVAKGNPIKVVSPYIGLRYFQRLVELSSDWHLISDVEAWLSSLAKQERMLSTQFILDNCERIHHFPAIHAKMVIGHAAAYLGSANLTSAGIQTRTEMGVLVDEPVMIADLHSWFNELWQATSMPVMAEVLAYSHGLDSESHQKISNSALKSLSFDGEQVRARLMRLSDTPSGAVKPAVVSKSLGIERNLFRDLEDEVRMLIEKLANSGFTFKELLGHIRKGRVASRTCAVYLELIRYCGNLPRSVFSPDTVNRLIYKNGCFRQSTASAVETSLSQHDMFLVMLIAWLSFADATGVQGQLETHSSIRLVWIRRWLYDLNQSGLLIEHIATVKDSFVSYQLNEKFEWTGRWRLFEQAHQAWNIKLKSYRGLATLSKAMTGDAERSRTGINIEESPDKPVDPIEISQTLSRGLGQSVYVRTHMEKRLPPNMATTVSPSRRLSPVKEDYLTISFNGTKNTIKQKISLPINSINYRADSIYCALFRRLAKSEYPGVIKLTYSKLIHNLAKHLGEPFDFVFQVLQGKIESLPTVARIVILKDGCSISALLNDIPTYPRTSAFLRTTLGKGKRNPTQLLNVQTKLKVELPERPTVSVKSNLSTASENRLMAHSMPEGKNEIPLQAQRLDEVTEYMQRVASIFKNSSA